MIKTLKFFGAIVLIVLTSVSCSNDDETKIIYQDAFEHYIGELYDGGMIYHLYKGSDGLEHGLIVSLTEGSAVWQTTPTLTNANRSWDGAFNTSLMTGSPAATYIATLGGGWYIPSIDEMEKLSSNRFEVNKALFEGGYLLISDTNAYWSSTEINTNYASCFYFSTSGTPWSKINPLTVRGVKSF
jgi:hypothetical protein